MRVSIITVCYNAALTIEATLQSVFAQSHPDLEYIVVDGGSRDGTVDIIRRFAERQAEPGRGRPVRMIWRSEPDRGMYDAINKGIGLATGEVVGILNADDMFERDTTAAEVLAGFGPETDAVYGDIRFVADDGERTLRYYSARHWKPWMLQWGYMPPHPSVYIRRELFARLGGYKLGYHIAADNELIIRHFRRGGLRTRYLPRCVVRMRMGGKSTRGWRSTLLLNREIVKGNRENGYFCCLPMLIPKYAFKVFEFILPALKRRPVE